MKKFARVLAWSALCAVAFPLHAEKAKPFVFTPSKKTGPLPVAVWLHGYRGYSPEGYMPGETAAALQKHAESLGAVIVGFPATKDLGDNTQQWLEEPAIDHAYVQSRLKEIGQTVKLDLSRVALFGFSQGAMVAADLATQYPESYLGAIMMSPGGLGRPQGADARKPGHEKQVFFCLCGAEENPANVELTTRYAKHLEKDLGATVTLKLYPGVSRHARPPDFMKQFPVWMGAILKIEPKP